MLKLFFAVLTWREMVKKTLAQHHYPVKYQDVHSLGRNGYSLGSTSAQVRTLVLLYFLESGQRS